MSKGHDGVTSVSDVGGNQDVGFDSGADGTETLEGSSLDQQLGGGLDDIKEGYDAGGKQKADAQNDLLQKILDFLETQEAEGKKEDAGAGSTPDSSGKSNESSKEQTSLQDLIKQLAKALGLTDEEAAKLESAVTEAQDNESGKTTGTAATTEV